MFDILANPMYLGAVVIGIALVGMIIFQLMKGGILGGSGAISTPKVSFGKGGKVSGKDILLLRPRDHRFMPVPVDVENSRAVICKKVDKVSRRFYKIGPAWTNPEARQTLFLAVDGYGYIANIKKPDEMKLTMKEALIELWTKEFYDKVPKPYRDVIETSEYGLIVDVSIPEESDDFPFKGSESLDEEDRAKMLHELANPDEKVPLMKSLMPIVFGFVCGMSVVLLINALRGM